MRKASFCEINAKHWKPDCEQVQHQTLDLAQIETIQQSLEQT